MAAVLSEKFPHKATHLFGYQWRIIHATKTFRGTAWVAYDRLYRRQAASQHSLDWAAEDSALYNEAFVGQAKIMAQCRHCLSENHQSEACPEFLADCLWSPFPLPSPPTHPCTQPNTPQAVKYVENSSLQLPSMQILPCVLELWSLTPSCSLLHCRTITHQSGARTIPTEATERLPAPQTPSTQAIAAQIGQTWLTILS